jgi:hypothetical protein
MTYLPTDIPRRISKNVNGNLSIPGITGMLSRIYIMANIIPFDVRDVLTRLKFISKVQENLKINVTGYSFTKSKSIIGAIYRNIRGEDRNRTIEFIHQTIDEALECIDVHRDNIVVVKYLYNGLTEAKNGILHLITTYEDDPITVSRLEIAMEKIDIILKHGLHRTSTPDTDIT